MSNWSAVRAEYEQQSSKTRLRWCQNNLKSAFSEISVSLNDSNVLLYFSGFLQKPTIDPAFTQMMGEDINGVMNALYGMDFSKELTVIMHTPGGDIGAVEQITDYIHSKFKKVTVVVPVMSMSAGSMFALSCDKIIISRAGQLGPTDPQLVMPQGIFSVKAIIQQFYKARADILQNPVAAHVWAPILQAYGPAMQEKAIKIENYATKKIKKWLANKGTNEILANEIINLFHDSPDFHGQRIDYEDLRQIGLNVELLENSQERQNAVMKVYHLATILVETSPVTKCIIGNNTEGSLQNDWAQHYTAT